MVNAKLPFELRLVLGCYGLLLLLVIIALVVIRNIPSMIVSNAVVMLHPTTRLIDFFDSQGNVVQSVALETAWPAFGVVTDEFGTHSAWRRQYGLGIHSGLDIAPGPYSGTLLVHPIMAGTVISIDHVDDSNCGRNVLLQHDNNVTSLYCHLEEIGNISYADTVRLNEVLGIMGSTGASSGVHVHVETRVNGYLVDPKTFLPPQL